MISWERTRCCSTLLLFAGLAIYKKVRIFYLLIGLVFVCSARDVLCMELKDPELLFPGKYLKLH